MYKFIAGITLSVLITSGVYAKDIIITVPDDLDANIQAIVDDLIAEGKKSNPDYYISEAGYLSNIIVGAAQSWKAKQKEDEEIKLRDMLRNLSAKDQADLINLLKAKAGR